MIKDVVIKKLEKFSDDRGWLIEIMRNDETDYSPAMAYVSETNPGFIRGPHEHKNQSDLFVFLGPGTYELYLWDNRSESPTYKEKQVIVAGETDPKSIIVPPGVVHGYKCTSDKPGYSINLPDKLYKGDKKSEEVDEIRHEDDPNSEFKIK